MKNFTFQVNEYHAYVIDVMAEDNNGWISRIGRYNFLNGCGHLEITTRKEYSRFGNLLNAILKINYSFSWSPAMIDACKLAAKTELNNEEVNATETVDEVVEVVEQVEVLPENEKEVISTRLGLNDSKVLDQSVFTIEELKKPTVLRLISEHANKLASEKTNNNKPVSEWNRQERADYTFYVQNILVNIIDGFHLDIVDAIRAEYNKHEQQLNHIIMVEKSFELPDHEVALNIYIERSNRPKEILAAEHKQLIINAIAAGLNVPEHVLADYPELMQSNSADVTNNKKVELKTYNKCQSMLNKAELLLSQGFATNNDLFMISECMRSIKRYEENINISNSIEWDQLHIKNNYNEIVSIFNKINKKHADAEKIMKTLNTSIEWIQLNAKNLSDYSSDISRALYIMIEMDQLLDQTGFINLIEYDKFFHSIDVLDKNFLKNGSNRKKGISLEILILCQCKVGIFFFSYVFIWMVS